MFRITFSRIHILNPDYSGFPGNIYKKHIRGIFCPTVERFETEYIFPLARQKIPRTPPLFQSGRFSTAAPSRSIEHSAPLATTPKTDMLTSTSSSLNARLASEKKRPRTHQTTPQRQNRCAWRWNPVMGRLMSHIVLRAKEQNGRIGSRSNIALGFIRAAPNKDKLSKSRFFLWKADAVSLALHFTGCSRHDSWDCDRGMNSTLRASCSISSSGYWLFFDALNSPSFRFQHFPAAVHIHKW